MLHSVHKTSCFHISVNSCHPKNSETKIFFGPFTECERFKSIQNKQYWQTYLITFKPITPVCLHACVRLPVALSYSASRPLLEEDIHFTATWPGLTSSNEQPSVPTRINSSAVKTRRPLRVVYLMRFCAENPHLGGDWRHRRYFIQEQEVLHHGTKCNNLFRRADWGMYKYCQNTSVWLVGDRYLPQPYVWRLRRWCWWGASAAAILDGPAQTGTHHYVVNRNTGKERMETELAL